MDEGGAQVTRIVSGPTLVNADQWEEAQLVSSKKEDSVNVT